jgi:Metallo-beta-lactamase superfamily
MPHRFVAVDVGTGDAFFIQRESFLALIDGGQASGFPRRLYRAVSRDAMNVLVCTHNDCDHANGILEFLEEGGHADECWLPATWMEAACRLCTASTDEIESLLFDADEELPEQIPRDEASEISAAVVEDQLSAFEDGNWEAQRFPNIAGQWLRLPQGLLLPQHLLRTKALVPPLFADALRILSIALAAARLQIRIRWFDPEFAPSGSPSLPLSVVNAREVTSIRRAGLTLKGVVRLTTVNRLSLVLYSPPDDEAPGVLLCADSGFGNLPKPPADRGMIVTAPHHGAGDKENIAVYQKLDFVCSTEEPASWNWVRSDRDCAARPCVEYLQRQKRYCTRCRGQSSKQPFQSVFLLVQVAIGTRNPEPT